MKDSKASNMNKLFFENVSIIGVGLIGASFALAIRQRGLCRTIYGYGRKEENLKKAKERGIIDECSTELKMVCENSDLIFLSTPIGVFNEIIQGIKGVVKKGALITDAGSVKGRLVYELEKMMPDGVDYVGSHPIAGSDKSGIDEARHDLFVNARCIVTPTENSRSDAVQRVLSIWNALGAKAELMDPYIHDEIYALVSHLPHVIAYVLVNTVGDIDSKYIEYAGRGFKDTTRIGLSSPELWRDISLFNKDNILKLLNVFRMNLDKIERLLMENNASGIEEEFSMAQRLRSVLEQKEGK